MRSRRQFFRLSLIALLAAIAERALPRAQTAPASAARTPSATQLADSIRTPLFTQVESPEPLELPTGQPPSPTPHATATSYPTPAPYGTVAPLPATSTPQATVAPLAQTEPPHQVFMPIVQNDNRPNDMPILGSASGMAEQAITWFARYAIGHSEYTAADITTIVETYQQLGDLAGLDWFLALAQMAHETGNITSWWAQPPRRNPAGIGVTGATQPGTPDQAPGRGWNWDERTQIWREGWSFPTWDGHAIPAHFGRLLAYALHDEQADPTQLALIKYALGYRALPAAYRGSAPTICGLNGRWAVPGTTYGQSIIALARRMREG
ncbi:MAG: hypothetical protein ACJ8CR_11430 [Roseiflexaceae bacterium]